jgi:hypothetical protein
MTLTEARQLLDATRSGAMRPTARRIRKALQLTGDLRSTWCKRPAQAVERRPA